ncbi:MAG: DUF1508 domain-containing protein [Myxococcales bacterium]|nr:DUF1508 domain-containing protein [Myxococcales bacterium]
MRNIHSLLTALVLSLSTLSAVGCATVGADEDAEIDGEAASAGKLTFWQASDGQWHFNLKSGNGAVLLTSEAYTSRTGSINGALSVLENGVDPAMYTVNKTATGYNLHLKAANGEGIAFSQVYSTKSNATRAINSSVKAVTSYLDKQAANTTGARVEVLFNEATNKFRFNVHARNGQVVLSSEQYTTEAAAFNGAFAVQAEGQKVESYTLKANAAGGYYFNLSALNGQVIGTSQQYTTKAAAQDAMKSLQSFLPTVTVL